MREPDAPEGDGLDGCPRRERHEQDAGADGTSRERGQDPFGAGEAGAPGRDGSAERSEEGDGAPSDRAPGSWRPSRRESDAPQRRQPPQRERLFEPSGRPLPKGCASISLLFALLIERTQARAWTESRQRAHARALLDLACDHYFTDEELAVLEAFMK